AFFSSTRLLVFVGVPLCLLQAALAAPGMQLLFQPKWAPAIPVVQVLSIAMCGHLFVWQATALLQAQKRLTALLLNGVISVLVFLAFVYAGAKLGEALSVAV